jgi:hypothetical protein
LKSINIEAFVMPVELLRFECLFNSPSLCFVWSDNPVWYILILEVPSEKYNSLDFLLVLKAPLAALF